jgi:hypothetical protein
VPAQPRWSTRWCSGSGPGDAERHERPVLGFDDAQCRRRGRGPQPPDLRQHARRRRVCHQPDRAAARAKRADAGHPQPHRDVSGYRKIDGQVYYHPQASDELRRLDVGPTGQITGFTAIGNFNGTATPNSITGGDIDFAADGAVWVTGNNDTGNPRLWGFDFNSLNQLVNVATTDQYNGITFNAAGDTLYGYRDTTGQYGIIDRATGGFQSVVATDLSVFGVGGDLATGTLIVMQVPEPSALAHVSAAVLGSYFARRTHQKRRQHYR